MNFKEHKISWSIFILLLIATLLLIYKPQIEKIREFNLLAEKKGKLLLKSCELSENFTTRIDLSLQAHLYDLIEKEKTSLRVCHNLTKNILKEAANEKAWKLNEENFNHLK